MILEIVYKLKNKQNTKLIRKYNGLYSIIHKISPLAYEIDPKNNKIHPVVSIQYLTRYRNGDDLFYRGLQEPGPVEYVDHLSNDSEVDDDGWVKGKGGLLLFWVPLHHRFCLHRPSNTRIIGPNETRLDFTNARWGEDWASCFTP